MKRQRQIKIETLVYTVEQAAESLCMGRTKAYELVAAGVIPSVKIDGMRRVPVDALRRWIDAGCPVYDGRASIDPGDSHGQAAGQG